MLAAGGSFDARGTVSRTVSQGCASNALLIVRCGTATAGCSAGEAVPTASGASGAAAAFGSGTDRSGRDETTTVVVAITVCDSPAPTLSITLATASGALVTESNDAPTSIASGTTRAPTRLLFVQSPHLERTSFFGRTNRCLPAAFRRDIPTPSPCDSPRVDRRTTFDDLGERVAYANEQEFTEAGELRWTRVSEPPSRCLPTSLLCKAVVGGDR